jgi:hypothetical protein
MCSVTKSVSHVLQKSQQMARKYIAGDRTFLYPQTILSNFVVCLHCRQRGCLRPIPTALCSTRGRETPTSREGHSPHCSADAPRAANT